MANCIPIFTTGQSYVPDPEDEIIEEYEEIEDYVQDVLEEDS